MAVGFSPIGNDAPFLDASGNPLSGGLLYVYLAGSSTLVTTYKDSGAVSQNTNPIVLNANGYPAAGGSVVSIWLTTGFTYLFTLKTSAGVTVWSRDNVAPINDISSAQSEWIVGVTPTYVSGTSFTVSGDLTATLHVGRRVKTTNTAGTRYSTITASSYSGGTGLTTITVVSDSGTLDSGLSAMSYAMLSGSNASVPGVSIAAGVWTFQNATAFTGNVSFNGNTTIGDASGDTLTQNAGTITIGNNYVETRAMGAAAAGTNLPRRQNTTWTGDAGGTSLLYAHEHINTFSGAQSASESRVDYTGVENNATAGTLTTGITNHAYFWNRNASATTNVRIFQGHMVVSGAGNVNDAHVFNAASVSMSSTGAITSLTGFSCSDIGHASLITNSVGFKCADFTDGPGGTNAFQSQMTAGTGKRSFYDSGGANNIFVGNMKIGADAVPSYALDVTGAGLISAGVRIGADSTNNLIDDASTGAGTATLYIGNASINVTSDIRVKPFVQNTERDGLDLVNRLRVVDHNWNDPSDRSPNNRNSRGLWMGLIAQEVVDVAPWAVNAPDRNCHACRAGEHCNEHPSLWVLEREHLVPILIKAVQQLAKRIQA